MAVVKSKAAPAKKPKASSKIKSAKTSAKSKGKPTAARPTVSVVLPRGMGARSR